MPTDLYWGKTFKELHEMSMNELIELLNARQRRSLKREFKREHHKLLEKIRSTTADKVIKTHCRDMVIIPEMVGRKIGVHNGKEFITVEIKPEMIGHYLGEFAITNKRVVHGKAGIGATKGSTAMSKK
ncbi:MAG: 30S ribosomal protein S19 [Candidatus Korarchaeota archaeon]